MLNFAAVSWAICCDGCKTASLAQLARARDL